MSARPASLPTAGPRRAARVVPAEWTLSRLASYWRDPALHLLLIVVGYRLAYELRFDFATPAEESQLFWISLPLLILIRLTAYAKAGVFRAYWLHFGLQDLLTLATAVTISSLCFVVALALADLFPGVPRSVLLVEWASAIFFAGGIPFIARSLREGPVPFVTPSGRRTIVVGAGERAEQLLREARRAEAHALNVVALVDLDGSREGRTIRGVRVVGRVDELPELAERLRAEFAIIALEPADSSEMRRVVDQCIEAGLEFKTLPSLDELLSGAAGANQLRNVRIEDLLGRPPVNLDLTAVRTDLHQRVILLTGAAGSIGSELARQIAAIRPARLVLLDQSESDLYFIHLELMEAHPGLELAPVICDITNQSRLAQVYAQHRPEYVIHAAAYKHVPLMETNVLEAVRNNVLGTLLVATNAVRYGASKVLLVSTDKAIRPSSVMGATKRVAERIIFGLPNLHRAGTDFRAVRFGNVLASRGSVIPLFERQLAAGGPITVTHRDVERYFMTIPEAAQLVLQAGSLPETAGAIAMLEMGEPVRILDLAEKLIRFSGRVPGRDIQIVFTGLRPGEKLTEEQISALEATVPTSAEKIRISQTSETAGPELVQKLSRLFAFLDAGDRDGLLRTLCELVPECVQPLRDYQAAVVEPVQGTAAGAWAALVDSSDSMWRERRRAMARATEPPPLRLVDRRDGEVCRRKTPRVGGRRRTDVGALLATGTGSGH
ncbi:MAG TPA: nucleoside-diphosphate sugar epimerase/dehydratase [Gemmatimonadales bacterium]|nr:nucleoside-diphosphate sugar epimerase/dehydratase [Gemmatimonadales bacterium]